MNPELQRFRDLGIQEWATWDEGLVGDMAFPHSVAAEYSPGVIEPIRFGAFVGWRATPAWWLYVAARLPAGALANLGLLDIEHQAGGHRCAPWFCVALPVRIHESQLMFASALCRELYHAQGGYLTNQGDPHDEQWRTFYADQVCAAGLTVNDGLIGRYFMEAAYPLDASPHNFGRFLADPDAVRARLQPIMTHASPGEQAAIFILAENSD